MDNSELFKMATDAKKYSYSPYSGFKVGAALLTDSGKVYTGTNVENASFGATNCAERTAVFKAVSEGERKIVSIAISGESDSLVFPCGICRQVLVEFGDENTKVICGNRKGDIKVFSLKELLPNAFTEFEGM
ncbi:UNVERIFIED_CONTAM: cytidine deaminase [Acetivibrio alkalicellulosi]